MKSQGNHYPGLDDNDNSCEANSGARSSQYEAEDLKNVTAFEPQASIEGIKTTLPVHSNQIFTGRAEHLERVKKLFRVSKANGHPQRAVLWGLGGIGWVWTPFKMPALTNRTYIDRKSQIALKYAQNCAEALSIFWVKADTAENAAAGFSRIAKTLIPEFSDPNTDKQTLSVVCRLLEREDIHPWLLVLDQADDSTLFDGSSGDIRLLDYMPRAKHGQILLTTRDSRLLGLADNEVVPATHGVNVCPMTPEESKELFSKVVRQETLEDSTEQELTKLLDLLAGLPLAILQAASYIRHVNGATVRGFSETYTDIERHVELFARNAFAVDLVEQKSVLTTWEISYKHIAETQGATTKAYAAIILDLLGFIDSKSSVTRHLSEPEQALRDINESVERNTWLRAQLGPQSAPVVVINGIWQRKLLHEADLQKAIGILRNYSLVTTKECWVHPIVHDWSYRRLVVEERHKYMEWIIDELSSQFKATEMIEGSWWGYLHRQQETPFEDCEDLSILRNARPTLDLVFSARMLEYRQSRRLKIRGLGTFLYRLGEICFHQSNVEDALRFLNQSIMEADDTPSERVVLLRARLLRARVSSINLSPRQTTIEAGELYTENVAIDTPEIPQFGARAKNRTELNEVQQQIRLWLAECHITQGSTEGGVEMIERGIEIIEQMLRRYSISDLSEYEVNKPLIIGKLIAATTLMERGDEGSKSKARTHLHDIDDFIQQTHPMNEVRMLLPVQLMKLSLQVAEDDEDRYEVCRKWVKYEKETKGWMELRLLGGSPCEWLPFLNQLKRKEKWAEIEAFAAIYTLECYSLCGVMAARIERPHRKNEMQEMIVHWAKMHRILAEAYWNLLDVVRAENHYWKAFSMLLYLTPEEYGSPLFKSLVYDWANALDYQEGPEVDVADLRANYRKEIEDEERLRGDKT
jgi:hypothetical protein